MDRNQPYQPSLDGLRALAALGVFGVHLEQAAATNVRLGPFHFDRFLENGRLGVAMFLMLSGYCLAEPIWTRTGPNRLATLAKQLPRRRFARIIPVYWAILTAIWLAHAAKQPMDWFLHALLIHNCWPQTLYSMSEPFWAIAVFAQYYVFWWGLLWLLHSLGWTSNRALLTVFAGMGLLVWCVCAALEGSGLSASVFGDQVWRHGLLIHLPIFALGALTSWIAAHGATEKSVSLDALGIFGMIALVLAMAYQPVELPLPASRYAYPLIPMLFALIILSATHGVWTKRLLSSRWLVFGGTISYAFYLVHLPVIRLTRRVLLEVGVSVSFWLLASGALALSITIAYGLTTFIETPFRRLMVGSQTRPHVSQ